MSIRLTIDVLKLRLHEGYRASCKVQSDRIIDSWFASEPNTGGAG
jgi:hypothetical protein